MAFCRRPAFWVAFIGLCAVALEQRQYGVDAARLAATKAAREEAAAKRGEGKSPEEIQKEKERLEKLKGDIETLLKDSKEYRHVQLKKKQEEEVKEYTPEELEETELWRKEYEKFMKAEKNKDRWERVGIVSAVSAAVAGGLAAFGKAHENAGGVAHNPSASRLIKGAGTAALLSGAGAMLAWMMRRQNKKRQKLHNARLARMQFEARTGLQPSDQNVLGPDEEEILNPKKKKDNKKEED